MNSRSTRFAAWLGAVLLLLIATSLAQAGSSKAKAKGSKGTKIAAADQCVVSKERSVVHVLFDVAYTKPEPMQVRYVYQLVCEAGAKECSGVQLYLSSLEKGSPIAVNELNLISGAKIVEKTATTTKIQWGPLRTFTVDWKRGEVQYVESGEGEADIARGSATTKCQVDDFRPCKRDDDCLGGLSCTSERCTRPTPDKARK